MSNQGGLVAELEVAAKLTRLGFAVSFPFGDHRKYDLIADDDQRLYRVQVKRAARNSTGTESITFKFTSPKSGVKYTPEEVDALVVWYPDADTLYWIASEDFDKFGSQGYLWFSEGTYVSRKRQMAKRYELCTPRTFQ